MSPRTLFRFAAFVVGAFALALQYALVAPTDDLRALATWTVNFFSFFTILTNTLAALAMIAPILVPNSTPGRFFDRPSVRAAIAGYIIIVGAIYFLVLRHTWSPTGWALVADALLHYVTPVLFVADWLLFVPKGFLNWRYPPASLVFPLVYVGWTLLHGALSGWYPYPFADVSALGYPAVLMNMVAILAAFLAVAAIIKMVDALAGRRSAAGEATHSALPKGRNFR